MAGREPLPGRPAAPEPETVTVGDIVGAHGLRGWLRVYADQSAPGLTVGGRVLLERDGVWRESTVTHVAPHGRSLVLLGLDDVRDRTTAEMLRGATLRVRRDEMPALAPDEYWHHEVIGFAVETLAGTVLGRVTGIMTTGLHDVWEVRNGTREYLLPVVAEVVHTIDREGRRVRIDPIPGLLD